MLSAKCWRSLDGDGVARADASAILSSVRSAARTTGGGFEKGQMLERIAGTAPAALRGSRKEAPAAHVRPTITN
jgi:hypothetical protein